LILESQQKRFFGETDESLEGRIFYTKLITSSFLRYDEALINHFSIVAYWLYMQLRKRVENIQEYSSSVNADDLKFLLDFTFRQKANSLRYLSNVVAKLIEAQQQKNFRKAFEYYSHFTLPTICLGGLDLLSKGSLKGYYIEGSLAVIKELYTATEDSSPIAAFVLQSIGHTMSALFIPTYDFNVLYEIFDVLKDFGPILRKENDEILTMHYEKLIDYLDSNVLNSTIKYKKNDEFITSYPSDMIYELYHSFNSILPSEVFTIPTMGNPIQRVFYLFYFMVGRAMDNVFPETRYLTQHRYIGPTTVYPFTIGDIYDENLSPDLIYFANYSLRVLTFFSRRSDFFSRYMKIMNPFPEKLPENRFLSRKTSKVKETQIINFKNSIIRPWNYPHLEKNIDSGPTIQPTLSSSNHDSPSSSHTSGSFSTNFGSLFQMDALTFDSNNANDYNESMNDYFIDLFDFNTESGLLNTDYDPLVKDWKDDTLKTKGPIASIGEHLEDRTLLMKEFTRKG